jgi:hypothetical protein
MSIILFVALCVLQMCDVYSTKRLLDASVAHEANPVMRFLIDKLGTVAGLVLPKLVVLALAFAFLLESPVILAPLCIVYVAVVTNNFRLMRKLMK